MSIGIIATLRIKDGEAAAFETFISALAKQVRTEPGNLLYQVTRSRAEPNTYKFLEIYRDQDAVAAHREAEHQKAAGPQFGAFLNGRPEIELLDSVD